MRAKPYDAVNIIRHANGYSLEAVPAQAGAGGCLTRPAPLDEVQVFNSIDALFTHLRRGFQEEQVDTCTAEKAVQATHEVLQRVDTMQKNMDILFNAFNDMGKAMSDKAIEIDRRLLAVEPKPKSEKLAAVKRKLAEHKRRSEASKKGHRNKRK